MKPFSLTLFLVAVLTLVTEAQIGHWKFNNDGSDASGNGLTGTLVGSPTFSTDSKEGSHSIVLTGTQYVNLNNPSILPSGTTPKTISAWAKTTTTSGEHMIISYGTNSNSQAFYISQNGTSLVAGGFSNNITVTNFWTTGVWHHICLTYDGTTARLYADGVMVSSVNKTWNTVLYRAYIGRHVTHNAYWSGNLDAVRIYDTALSDQQVLALPSSAPQVPQTPTTLTASAVSSSQIDLSWSDNSTDETGFLIERSQTSSTSGFSPVTTVVANTSTYSNTGLTPATQYYYRVSAVNSNGNSSYVEATATTLAAPPQAPTGLTVTGATASSISLSWSDNSTN